MTKKAAKKIDLKKGLAKTYGTRPEMRRLSMFPVDNISARSDQPRKFFDKEKIAEIAESIKNVGLINPIIVQIDPDDSRRYFVVAGERRWRAHQLLGRKEIEGVLLQDGVDADEIALIENVQREDLTPLEEALGYQKLMEVRGYSQAQVGDVVGKKRTTVNEILKIADLPGDIKEQLVDYPNISKTHLVIVAQEKDYEKQKSLWARVRGGLLTAKDTKQVKKGKKATIDLSPTERVIRSMSGAVTKLEKLDRIDDLSIGELKKLQRRINKALKDKSGN